MKSDGHIKLATVITNILVKFLRHGEADRQFSSDNFNILTTVLHLIKLRFL